MEDAECKDSGLPEDPFKNYREKKQIDLDSIPSIDSSYNGLDYSNNLQKTLRSLALSLKKRQMSQNQDSSWHTCIETSVFASDQKKNFPENNKFHYMDLLYSFLKTIDCKKVKEYLDTVNECDLMNHILKNFDYLNVCLFNCMLKDVVCRWSESCSK